MTEPAEATLAFSLTRGGPLYRLLHRLRIVRLDEGDVARQAQVFVALGWLPLVVFGLLHREWTSEPDGLLWHALPFHARYLLTLPLLLIGERVLETRCRSAIDSVATAELGAAAPTDVGSCARRAERLRDSWRAELAIAVIAFGTPIVVWGVTGRSGLIADYDPTDVSAVASRWHSLVSLPLFNFLLLRWLWRWLIWTGLMWQLSRLRFRLVPSHPDLAGGLGRLAEPTFAIASLQAGVSMFLATSWGVEIAQAHVSLSSYVVHFVAIVALSELLAIMPMLPFTRALTRARFEGGDAYSHFALAYTRLFHARWIDRAEREGLLGTPDISGLTDLISSVQHVDRMRISPFGRQHAIAVLACILAPMLPLPLVAAGVPVRDLLERTFMALVFGS